MNKNNVNDEIETKLAASWSIVKTFDSSADVEQYLDVDDNLCIEDVTVNIRACNKSKHKTNEERDGEETQEKIYEKYVL